MSSRNQRREDQTWEDWYAELMKVASDEGYEIRKGVLSAELAYWRELYGEGLTPREAWEK